MNLKTIFSDHSLSEDKIESALTMLELTRQDLASIGQTENRFVDLLRRYSTYSSSPEQNADFYMHYKTPADLQLTRLREQYGLAEIAGSGNEIDRLCNLMHWTHNLAIHTSNAVEPEKMNSLNLLRLIHAEGKHINCGMFATILNDVTLALGWKSRIVHLKPYEKDYIESHVLNAIYSQQLSKWLFFDPNLNAYFMDEYGVILSVVEIRQRLVGGMALRVNDDLTFNSDNEVFAALGQQYGKDFYLLYIAKNIFRYDCPRLSTIDKGSQENSKVVLELLPAGYRPEWLAHPRISSKGDQIISTTNITNFWRQP